MVVVGLGSGDSEGEGRRLRRRECILDEGLIALVG